MSDERKEFFTAEDFSKAAVSESWGPIVQWDWIAIRANAKVAPLLEELAELRLANGNYPKALFEKSLKARNEWLENRDDSLREQNEVLRALLGRARDCIQDPLDGALVKEIDTALGEKE